MWADSERVDERYGADTAKIFQSCIAANEPLPAAAFPVIICDSPYDMAISANVEKDDLRSELVDIDIARAQLNRRCQDLLSIVAPIESLHVDISLRCFRIEFLHRSVQDFLQQSEVVSRKLERLTGPCFSAHRTLLACYVYLVKKTGKNFEDVPAWSTQALLHLASIGDEYDASAATLLQELDKAMQSARGQGQMHWSNVSTEMFEGNPEFAEGGKRNLIGHLIEFNASHAVKAALNASPSPKCGRPWLDYALRYNPYSLDRWHGGKRTLWQQFSGDPAMVELLLNVGCDVNEPIHIYQGRTVWEMYVAFLYDQKIRDGRHLKTTWLLINRGAKPINFFFVREQMRKSTGPWNMIPHRAELSMKDVLARAFGEHEAENMCERVAKNDIHRGPEVVEGPKVNGRRSWLTAWMPGLGDGAP
jgi:hypothetical protein